MPPLFLVVLVVVKKRIVAFDWAAVAALYDEREKTREILSCSFSFDHCYYGTMVWMEPEFHRRMRVPNARQSSRRAMHHRHHHHGQQHSQRVAALYSSVIVVVVVVVQVRRPGRRGELRNSTSCLLFVAAVVGSRLLYGSLFV